MNTTIITDKLLHGGMASGKIDGKTIFISGALPQEEVSISITSEKKDYSIASIQKILTPSPHRKLPPCPLYGICGGCNLMHADDEYQRNLRMSILQDAFAREHIDIPSVQMVNGEPLGYRNRYQFESNGLRSVKSNTIIPIPHCLVAHANVNAFLHDETIPGKIRVFGCDAILNAEKGYVTAPEREKPVDKSLMRRGKKIKTGGKRTIYEGTTLEQDYEVQLKIMDTDLSFDVRGFFQSNVEMLEKTAMLIKKILPSNTKLLDMYGGVGTLSALCAKDASHVTLVEHNRDAVVYAEKNLRSIPHSSYGQSGSQWVAAVKNTHFDAVLIDPPRSGMEKEVRQWLSRSSIPLIISLSCDPVTHARDCAELVKNGYEIESLYALDYYPQTSHVESLSICIKK